MQVGTFLDLTSQQHPTNPVPRREYSMQDNVRSTQREFNSPTPRNTSPSLESAQFKTSFFVCTLPVYFRQESRKQITSPCRHERWAYHVCVRHGCVLCVVFWTVRYRRESCHTVSYGQVFGVSLSIPHLVTDKGLCSCSTGKLYRVRNWMDVADSDKEWERS